MTAALLGGKTAALLGGKEETTVDGAAGDKRLTTVAEKRGGLLVEREVGEGCAAWRNDRRCWMGEALLGGRERDCWVVRPLRYWTRKSLLGCAVRWITAALLGGRDGRWLR
jgi:hypothetical protein